MSVELLSAIADILMFIIAFIALIVAFCEYKSNGKTGEHKLFSQLNRRYQGSDDIQCVVRYLREIDPSEDVPSAYQVELFLRFFEELGMYLSTKSLSAKSVNNFFGFYLKRLYTTPRGHELLKVLNGEDEQLEYLNIVKKHLSL